MGLYILKYVKCVYTKYERIMYKFEWKIMNRWREMLLFFPYFCESEVRNYEISSEWWWFFVLLRVADWRIWTAWCCVEDEQFCFVVRVGFHREWSRMEERWRTENSISSGGDVTVYWSDWDDREWWLWASILDDILCVFSSYW